MKANSWKGCDPGAMERPLNSSSVPSGSREQGATRRTFLAWASHLLSASLGTIYAIPILAPILAALRGKTVGLDEEFLEIGRLEDFEIEKPMRVLLVGSLRDGWRVTRGVRLGSAWIVQDGNGKLMAFSAVCPHLGCSIEYDEPWRQFRCPCHGSQFELHGERQGGPASRGMDPLEVLVKEGRVFVRFQRFEIGIKQRKQT